MRACTTRTTERAYPIERFTARFSRGEGRRAPHATCSLGNETPTRLAIDRFGLVNPADNTITRGASLHPYHIAAVKKKKNDDNEDAGTPPAQHRRKHPPAPGGPRTPREMRGVFLRSRRKGACRPPRRTVGGRVLLPSSETRGRTRPARGPAPQDGCGDRDGPVKFLGHKRASTHGTGEQKKGRD